jgi:hypothetical protein
VHLKGMYLIGIYLMGVHFMGVRLTGTSRRRPIGRFWIRLSLPLPRFRRHILLLLLGMLASLLARCLIKASLFSKVLSSVHPGTLHSRGYQEERTFCRCILNASLVWKISVESYASHERVSDGRLSRRRASHGRVLHVHASHRRVSHGCVFYRYISYGPVRYKRASL